MQLTDLIKFPHGQTAIHATVSGFPDKGRVLCRCGRMTGAADRIHRVRGSFHHAPATDHAILADRIGVCFPQLRQKTDQVGQFLLSQFLQQAHRHQ